MLGPCTAPIARIKGTYRFHMILKAGSRKALNAALRGMLAHAEAAGIPRRNLVVDVDALAADVNPCGVATCGGASCLRRAG